MHDPCRVINKIEINIQIVRKKFLVYNYSNTKSQQQNWEKSSNYAANQKTLENVSSSMSWGCLGKSTSQVILPSMDRCHSNKRASSYLGKVKGPVNDLWESYTYIKCQTERSVHFPFPNFGDVWRKNSLHLSLIRPETLIPWVAILFLEIQPISPKQPVICCKYKCLLPWELFEFYPQLTKFQGLSPMKSLSNFLLACSHALRVSSQFGR